VNPGGSLARWAATALGLLAASIALAGEPRVEARILIQSSPLAGFQFYSGKAVWSEMKVGDPLALTREPDNPYDPNAVRVEWRGEKLGYVPRADNADLARHMDRGTKVEARISHLTEDRNPWKRIRFDVYTQP
jgi:hypothetical protein